MKLKNNNSVKLSLEQSLLEKRKQAIKELINLGVLIPFDKKLQLYHGRTTIDGRFQVKKNINNAGYYMGHYNVNSIPGLHTSTQQIAELYANARAVEQYKKEPKTILDVKQQVNKIVALVNNVLIFDICKVYDLQDLLPNLSQFITLTDEEVSKLKNNKLSPEQEKQLNIAISTLISTYTIPELLPSLFGNEQNIKVLKDLALIGKNNAKLGKQEYVFDDDLEKYLSKKTNSQLNQEQVQRIAGAINVYNELKNGADLQTLFSKLQSGFDFTADRPLNLELFKSFLQKINVCGVHQKIWKSDIIKVTNFDDYFFFDTSKINTEPLAKKIQSEQMER